MLSITKIFHFEASHQLMDEKYGKCFRLHGHSYKLEVTVTGMAGSAMQDYMVMNFTDLKAIVQTEILDKFDHQHLNEVLKTDFPTAEVIIQEIASILQNTLPSTILLHQLILWETANSCATWTRS